MKPGDPSRRFRLPWRTGSQIDAEVVEEFEFHVKSRAEELEDAGVAPLEARRRAEAEFGDAAAARAYCRQVDLRQERGVRRTERLAEFRLDLVYVGRTLARTPGAAAIIVAILGIALGINLITFTLANELLFRQLPVADPRSLVLVHGGIRQTHEPVATSIADWRDVSTGVRTMSGLAGFNGRSLALGTAGPPVVVPAQIVTANYFDVLGLSPALGRYFSAGEDLPGNATVAVISHQLWTDRFNASPGTIGSPIRLNGQPATIVGVTPRGFVGPFTGFRFDLFVPLGSAPALDRTVTPDDRAAGFLELFGRLRPGTAPQTAEAELNRLAAEPNRAVEVNRDRVFTTAPMTGLDTDLRAGVVALVTLIVTLSGLGLVVASLNAGGLLLARGMARQREMALRQALGAGRQRLIRLQLLETAVLVGTAIVTGLLVMLALRSLIQLLAPALPIPLLFQLQFDQRVVLFVAVLATVATIATGLAPAVATTGADVAERLRGGTMAGRFDSRLRRLFLGLQVAVTFALLIGAALLFRAVGTTSQVRQANADPVATLPLDLSFANYDDAAGRRLYQTLLARVRAMPGVERAAYAARLPFGFGGTQATIQIPGLEPPPGQTGFRVEINRISPEWIETVRVPLTSGRDFVPGDGADGPRVALVNGALARRFWPNADPLHRSLVANGQPTEVIGVVDDGRLATPGRPDLPRLYLSTDQAYSPRAILMVRGPVTGGPVGGLLHQAVSGLSPDLPMNPVTSLEANVGLAYLPHRLLGGATAIVALLTLLLAAFGLYGLLAFWVATRRTELGIRSALGAKPADVIGLAVRQGLVPTTYGVLAGLGLSAGVGLVLRRFLLGVSPFDPIAYLGGTAVFYVVAAIACLIPAARAAKVNPLVALRGG